MNTMSVNHVSVSLTLEQMLKLLRRDVSRILAKLDQSESLLEVEETLEDEKPSFSEIVQAQSGIWNGITMSPAWFF